MVPVLPPIAELLEKYKNHPYCIEKNVLIPIISNSCFNEYLKELAAICNISKVLKTHLARHTFAHIMLSYGVPLEVLSKMMGHRSIRTTQRYCRVSIQLIMDKVKPVRNKMFNKMGELKFFKKFSMKQTVTAMAA
jgi:site-specific recombinase XerD